MTKTFSFAVLHVTVAFTVGYLMTGNAMVGGAIALVEPAVNTIAYFFHERFWERLRRQHVPGRGGLGTGSPLFHP